MSEYTTRQILDMIKANGGPEGLNLSGKDLSEIDLSREAIQAGLARVQEENPEATPVWVSVLTGGINLEEANLQKADLFQANLREASLWRANLQEASLLLANLQEVELVLANLQGADLRGAELQGAFFSGVRLDHTEMDRSSLGPKVGEDREGRYDVARDAYLRLKQNFDDLGDYAASAWAYQKERQMEKACSAPWRARRFYGRQQLGVKRKLPAYHPQVWWFFVRHTGEWLKDWFVELLCGYGESIGRVLFWMFASFFGFAAYYWCIGGVWLVEPDKGAKVATSFWHYLIYSAGAFTTTQFARFQAADDRVRMVTAIQAIIGIVLAGLLGFVAGNRIRRS